MESLTTRLYEAVLKDDTGSLQQLFEEDPNVLEICNIVVKPSINSFLHQSSPLHVATQLNRLEIVKLLVSKCPDMCYTYDHNGRNPIHIAVIKGHREILCEFLQVVKPTINSFLHQSSPVHVATQLNNLEFVKLLVSKCPEMCYTYDHNGRNPVHIAAIEGHREILREFLRVVPGAARVHTKNNVGNDTILHLCVKHGRFEILEWLMNDMDVSDLVKAKDSHGNTLLHLAVVANQLEIVSFILRNCDNMEIKNESNLCKMTAMDICVGRKNSEDRTQILKSLKKTEALCRKEVMRKEPENWSDSQSNALMVVATIIVAMVFPVCINPPGGVWQDDNDYTAGESIVSSKYPLLHAMIVLCSTTALITSLSVILLLISGLTLRPSIVAILRIAMWVAISATTVTYVFSLESLISDKYFATPGPPLQNFTALNNSMYLWMGLMGLLILTLALRLIIKSIKRRKTPITIITNSNRNQPIDV